MVGARQNEYRDKMSARTTPRDISLVADASRYMKHRDIGVAHNCIAPERRASRDCDASRFTRCALSRANCLSRLGGVALLARQFALLNRVRNTDIFFVGSKKNFKNFLTAIFKAVVGFPIINASLCPYHQGRRRRGRGHRPTIQAWYEAHSTNQSTVG